MNEMLVVFFILATLAVAYFWIYPRFAGDDVKKMAWLDFALGFIPLGLSGVLFWQSNPTFRMVFFDTNWFFFTVIALVLLELPLFFWYVKARGLGQAYREAMGFGGSASREWAWSTSPVKSVEKQLNDTKWDGLRTEGAKFFLVVTTNIVILAGSMFLFFVRDTAWAQFSLLYILIILVLWFLLRQSVRLVADAPSEALDERLERIRDRGHVIAYRLLAMLVVILATLLLAFTAYSDATGESDGFSYNIPLTWPQIQAIFWFLFAYATMLPSMAVIGQELTKKVKK